MKQLQTTGIVLSRTDYGEADRIVTILTPRSGKLRLMARGVRKIKSKLAGGIELFSVSDITYIEGRKEIGTLISSRLKQHYGNIVQDISRVQLGYELIKQLNKSTEDEPEEEYFDLLRIAFESLDDHGIPLDLVRAWFDAQLLKLAGHAPNLSTDSQGHKLEADQAYNFDFEAMAFAVNDKGRFGAAHIKTLRLLFGDHSPADLKRVEGLSTSLEAVMPLLRTMTAGR